MLATNKTITKLDLSWNSIRSDSAITLAKVVVVVFVVVGCGDDGGVFLLVFLLLLLLVCLVTDIKSKLN